MRHQVSTESIPPEPVLIENMTDLQLEVADAKAREDLARAYGMRHAIIRERERRGRIGQGTAPHCRTHLEFRSDCTDCVRERESS